MTKLEYEEMMKRCEPKFYDIDTKPFSDVLEWLRYLGVLRDSGEFKLKEDFVGKYKISTVYVGLDMGMFNPEPLIFETMIFCEDDPLDLWMDRYSYKQQALEGHEQAVLLAKEANDR